MRTSHRPERPRSHRFMVLTGFLGVCCLATSAGAGESKSNPLEELVSGDGVFEIPYQGEATSGTGQLLSGNAFALASPDGRYGLAVHQVVRGVYGRERVAYLCDLLAQRKRITLDSTWRFLGGIWSWDSRAFVVNNFFAPGGCHPLLYRIHETDGGDFAVEHTDLTTSALAYLRQVQQGRVYFKYAIMAEDWSGDSSKALLHYYCRVREYDDEPTSVAAQREPLWEEGYLVYDLETSTFSHGRDGFRSAIPAVGMDAKSLEQIDKSLATRGDERNEEQAPVVLAWRRDRKAFVVQVQTTDYDWRFFRYNSETGNVEPTDWIPAGWVSRCNYVRFAPRLDEDGDR